MANSLGGLLACERWSEGWSATCSSVLDKPPSLAVALVQLVAGLGTGVPQWRHLVEQGVVWRLAKQGHQQGNAEASSALTLDTHHQYERKWWKEEAMNNIVSGCRCKVIFILSFWTFCSESNLFILYWCQDHTSYLQETLTAVRNKAQRVF